MELAYAAADLVVCRSGANTVCELTAVGLPRRLRARCRSATGSSGSTPPTSSRPVADSSVDDASFTPDWITDNVVPSRGDGERLLAMGTARRRSGSVTPTTRWPTWCTARTRRGRLTRERC
jgi:UDP-N-acetylglucosamine--N-acetylmuramyl-(pentapeptide) pyrophosphoryl-undecaprenol N-acetylglucosamine transferase